MTTPNLPNKDAIAELLWSILTKFHGRITDEDYYDIPACQEAQKAVQALLTTTANARVEQFAAELKAKAHTGDFGGGFQMTVIEPSDITATLKRFIGGTS